MPTYAHSIPGRPEHEWEPLATHLAAVGDRAGGFASEFGWGEIAGIAGRLHDIGKCSAEFMAYLKEGAQAGARGPDHSTAGAREAATSYPGLLGQMLAYIIAGHHAGLADGGSLKERLGKSLPDYAGWERDSGLLPPPGSLKPPTTWTPGDHKGFAVAFLVRMLFSCLVDADRLETDAFYAEREGRQVGRGGHASLDELRTRLRAHMAAKQAEVASSELNGLRAEILGHVLSKASSTPGLFTLTVPTGGGKTLASLSFALDHAVRHGLRRVVYVIPYTSIIEQTAEVFRQALGTFDDVLEHHSSFDWERAPGASGEAGAGTEELARLRRASENWDVPIVVTTAVQFFESLFAARTSPCRKLHNLAKSVIVLDEAQTLPVHLLLPCMAAIDQLQRNYGASVVLCTATQPALRKIDGAIVDEQKRPVGLDIPADRELAPDPLRLYTALKRVAVETLPEPIGDDVIVARLAEQAQMLCIVNSRAHALKLFDAVAGLPGAVHLTTLMCPRHRRVVLARLRRQLLDGEPVRLVATSLIEAGVDIDFPEVWRAAAGIDSIAQAAGRCNREARSALGRVVVFTPAEDKPPRSLIPFEQAARAVLRRHQDPLTLAAIEAYFRELYFVKGSEALDASKVDGYRGILPAIAERTMDRIPFASIAEAFRMIDEVMEPVIVPWRADTDDDDADRVLARIAAMERPLASDLRRLQQYTVSIPPKAREEWLARGVLRPVHPAIGDGMLAFADLAHYDEKTGVRLQDGNLRLPGANIIT